MHGQFLNQKKYLLLFVNTREVGANNYMTWDQIRELFNEDFVEIDSHSHTHEYLVDEELDFIKKRYKKIYQHI